MDELSAIMERFWEDPTMFYIVSALLAALVLLLLAVFLWRGSSNSNDTRPWPFFPKRPLTDAEQTLYHRLVKALPDHIILAQVQLVQLLGVRKGYNFQEWNNRISNLSADFVVCDKDATVIAVIELDDGNRDRGNRQADDLSKNKALSAANIRLLRWQGWHLPDEEEINRQLFTPDTAPTQKDTFEAPLRATH